MVEYLFIEDFGSIPNITPNDQNCWKGICTWEVAQLKYGYGNVTEISVTKTLF